MTWYYWMLALADQQWNQCLPTDFHTLKLREWWNPVFLFDLIAGVYCATLFLWQEQIPPSIDNNSWALPNSLSKTIIQCRQTVWRMKKVKAFSIILISLSACFVSHFVPFLHLKLIYSSGRRVGASDGGFTMSSAGCLPKGRTPVDFPCANFGAQRRQWTVGFVDARVDICHGSVGSGLSMVHRFMVVNVW